MAAVRGELGPTLPALLRRRLGVPPAVTLAVAAIATLAAVAVVVHVLTRPPGQGEKIVHEAPPVFNMLYRADRLAPAEPRPGELMRLEGSQGRLVVEVVVRPLELPPYEGDVTHGQLPVFANRFVERQRELLPQLELTQEGRARVNNAVGYEVGWESITPEARTFGHDVLLVPDDPQEARGFVTIALRQHKPGGRFTKAERRVANASEKAYRSFRFGTERG